MGCTSSTPNTVAPNANSTEKNLKFSEETNDSMKDEDDIIYTDDRNEIKVLPTCDNDNIGNPIKLDSNNESTTVDKLESGRDEHHDGNVVDNIKTNDNATQEVEKLSKLEKVVEKVVELYVNENIQESVQNADTQAQPSEENNKIVSEDKTEKPNTETQVPESDEKEETDEPAEEALSPSQSESSRATRWEALADIAAELPPSLAVDPVTGQIYALSK